MAEKTAEDDLDLKPADAGAMFRVEMFTTNFLLGYWKHMVAAVVVILVSVLIYGQLADYERRSQRGATAQIANKLSELPDVLPALSEKVATGEAVDTAKLETVASDLVAIANGASGAARVEALLTASELYRMSGNVEEQGKALEAATDGPGVLGYAAESGIANLELAQGQGDAAVARLKALSVSSDGYLAEQAMIDMALALEHLGRNDEARVVYDEFLTRFPESPRADEVEQRKLRVVGGAG